MFVPTGRLALLVALGAAAAMVEGWRGELRGLLVLSNLLILAVALADAWSTVRPTQVTVRRTVPRTLALGRPAAVTFELEQAGDRPLRLRLRDTVDPELGEVEHPPPVTLPPERPMTVTYPLKPSRRGRFTVGGTTLRWRSRFGLFERQVRLADEVEVKVYPDLRALQRYELLRQAGRSLEAGIRAARLRGAGTEFESLREYQPDDEYRCIHWGATARRGKLVSRQYEVERSQTVMLCLDVGRLMTTRLDDRTRLDHAIATALTLAGIATQMQDKVGLLVFAEEPLIYLPPDRGQPQIHRILEATFDLEGRLIEPDYGAAFRLLGLRQRKRSLIVLFTDLIDAEASAALLTYTAALRPAHLPIFVSFRDPAVQRVATQPPTDVDAVYQRALAEDLLTTRNAALRHLRANGIRLVDAAPEQAAVNLVNQYIDAKVKLLI